MIGHIKRDTNLTNGKQGRSHLSGAMVYARLKEGEVVTVIKTGKEINRKIFLVRYKNKEGFVSPDDIILQKIVYISGRMTGVQNLNYAKFKHYEKKFLDKGYLVLNPHKIVKSHPDKVWQDYMKVDIAELMQADVVSVLDDWEKSSGAKLEIFIAKTLGIKVVYAETEKEFDHNFMLKNFDPKSYFEAPGIKHT